MKILLIILIYCMSLSQLNADNQGRSGEIYGQVLDGNNKKPLNGANIYIKEAEKGTSTGTEGTYIIDRLKPGVYTVRFSYLGYRSHTETQVVIRNNRPTQLDIMLETGSLEFEEVVITDGYYNHDPVEPVSRHTLNTEAIRGVPGSGQELSRVIHTLPGVASDGEMSQDLMVRGGSPNENGFYIDNIPVPSIQHFEMQNGSSNGPIGIVDTDLIRELEFHSGGFSPAYGGHLSSISNIRYKEGSNTNPHGAVTMNMAGFGGKFETPIAGGDGSLLLSGRRSYLDLIAEAVNSRGAPRYGDIQLKGVYNINQNNKITLLNIYGDSKIASNREDGLEEGWHTFLVSRAWQNTTGINWQYTYSSDLYSNTSLSYSRKNDNTTLHFTENEAIDSEFDVLRQYIHIRNHHTYSLNETNSLEFGFETQFKRGDYQTYVSKDIMDNGFIREESVTDLTLNGLHSGLFGSWTIHPHNRLSFSTGLRSTHNALNNKAGFLPRTAMSFDITSRLKFNASTGLYSQHIPYFFLSQKEDFEKLPDMKSLHLIGGLEYLLTDETRITLELYEKQYSDIPVQPPSTNAPNLQYVPDNVYMYEELIADGIAKARGIDLMIQKKAVKNFYGQITASLFRSRFRDLNGNWQNRDFDVRYLFNINGGYRPDNRWDFSMRWSYTGGRPYTPIDKVASENAGRTILQSETFNTKRMPAHHSLYLRTDRRFFFNDFTLTVFLELWNAYNRENVRRYYWDNTKKRIAEEPQFNTLPVGGFTVEF